MDPHLKWTPNAENLYVFKGIVRIIWSKVNVVQLGDKRNFFLNRFSSGLNFSAVQRTSLFSTCNHGHVIMEGWYPGKQHLRSEGPQMKMTIPLQSKGFGFGYFGYQSVLGCYFVQQWNINICVIWWAFFFSSSCNRFFAADLGNSSTRFTFCAGTHAMFFKLGAHWPKSPASNKLKWISTWYNPASNNMNVPFKNNLQNIIEYLQF